MSEKKQRPSLESVSGPALSPEALLWIEGKMSSEEYFALVRERTLAEAHEHVAQELAKRQAKMKLRFRDFLTAMWQEMRPSSRRSATR